MAGWDGGPRGLSGRKRDDGSKRCKPSAFSWLLDASLGKPFKALEGVVDKDPVLGVAGFRFFG